MDRFLWDKMWGDLGHSMYLEYPSLTGVQLQEIVDWLSDPQRPGTYMHHPESVHSKDSRVIIVVGEPNLFFELKMRWR
ncbi:MAG: hypothetical protein EOP84_27840 [Verrucomicrobiaceae bacterium]|nr:MAG: hypothetical protein EOP84_27840 [Verrucomicrobiaceae bacterium]